MIYELKNVKGYIKEYNGFDNVIFEGEYIDGLKNWKRKEFYNNGKIRLEVN